MTHSKNLRTFYTLLITQTFSFIGSQMSGLAVGIWVYERTGNATPLAIAASFAAVPAIFTAGFAGVFADRVDRRYMMMLSDAGQALATLFLLTSIATDSFQLWHLYLVAALEAIFGSFQFPAFMASVTMLVPDNHRDRANALQQLTGPLSGVIAPIIAGLIFGFVGVTGVMLIDLGTFLVAVLVVFGTHIPRPAQTEAGSKHKGSVWKEALVGFRYLWANPTLFVFVMYGMVINFPIRVVMILGTPYIISRTGSEAWLGTINGISSAGAVIGSIALGIWGGFESRIKTMAVALIVGGAFWGFSGVAQAPLVIGAMLFLGMLFVPAVDASLFSLLQIKIPPDLQGRVFSAILQIISILRPLAFITAGLLADHVFEPAVGTGSWDTFAPLFGNHAGAGMGMLIFLAGMIVAGITLLWYAIPSQRHMESILPDYAAEAAEEVVEGPVLDSVPVPA